MRARATARAGGSIVIRRGKVKRNVARGIRAAALLEGIFGRT